jgi:hypothetical protein
MKLLITNFEDELTQLAKSALEIRVLIAFLTEGGLKWLPDRDELDAEFIVGVDLRITRPEALKNLQSRGASVRVFEEPGRMFHPKAIYLRTEEKEVLFVGSNNLTSSGISSNHEMGILAVRNRSSEGVFADFIAHFDALKVHPCCGIPDEKFYANYKPSQIPSSLKKQLNAQPAPLFAAAKPQRSSIQSASIKTLGDFIRVIAREFPTVERKKGSTVKDHPLKRLFDDEFKPLFAHIVGQASQKRLKNESRLTVGGQWYRIPNILAVNRKREPWSNTYNRGRLVLQIHFSADFATVFFSVVLQFNLPKLKHKGEMTGDVAERFSKLLEYVDAYSSELKIDEPVFHHWNYKKFALWGKPLMTVEYQVDSLPDDTTLCSDLALLATVLNGTTAIG